VKKSFLNEKRQIPGDSMIKRRTPQQNSAARFRG